MTNLEFWKDYLKKFGCPDVAVVGGIPQLCHNTACTDCLFIERDCEGVRNQCSQFFDWLLEEHKDIAIDWRRVPPDTDVMVRSIDSEEWEPRKFAMYLPNDPDTKFIVFGHGHSGKTREASSLSDLVGWEQCKLVHPEDLEKYQKSGQADGEENDDKS